MFGQRCNYGVSIALYTVSAAVGEPSVTMNEPLTVGEHSVTISEQLTVGEHSVTISEPLTVGEH